LILSTMRLHLSLSPNKSIVPYDHLPVLTGALHKWAGQNRAHDEVSLYSFAWLKGGRPATNGKGLKFPDGASWFISCYDEALGKQILGGILADPIINYGLVVQDVAIQDAPVFSQPHLFMVASPVFVKQKREDGTLAHCLYDNPLADEVLTKVLHTKLKKAGLADASATVAFERNYGGAKTHKANYQGIANRVSTCPVMITGQPETLAFAWEVGVGHSTGIGFGALY
jgi:CRISPR-associated endoribonuclease Cas6